MNKLMCFLTGGHKYADVNIKTDQIPPDTKRIILTNECIKCGEPVSFIMNVDAQMKCDLFITKKGGEG